MNYTLLYYIEFTKKGYKKEKRGFIKKRLLYSSCSSNKEASMLSELLKD